MTAPMAGSRQDNEQRVRAERARMIGLFRYQLLREVADPAHSTKARGRMVRAIAEREHIHPKPATPPGRSA